MNNVFAGTPTTCVACHLRDYLSTTNPPHQAESFPQDCTGCHTTTNWTGAVFNHAATGFALTGFHATMQCAQCHVNNNYSLTSAACWNCHQPDYNGTTNPAHRAAGFPQDCSLCHTTTDWTGAVFNHNSTPFPLTGAHVSVPCASCHLNNVFAETPTACVACHHTDYNNTTNPNHKAANLSTNCANCHTTAHW